MLREELNNWLKSLIASEFIAYMQYELASHNVEGTDYDACESEFKQHADEEREHMNTLIDCAIERDILVEQDFRTYFDIANPPYENMDATSSYYLIDFHTKAEESAIKTYREFYELIKDDDITLASTIKHILADEIEHRKDLIKISTSIKEDKTINDDTIYSNFSKLTERLKRLC